MQTVQARAPTCLGEYLASNPLTGILSNVWVRDYRGIRKAMSEPDLKMLEWTRMMGIKKADREVLMEHVPSKRVWRVRLFWPTSEDDFPKAAWYEVVAGLGLEPGDVVEFEYIGHEGTLPKVSIAVYRRNTSPSRDP